MNAEALQRLADEDLMPLMARKDAAAFEVYYDRHGGAAYSLAHRIVGDPQAAEDVTQEAFLSIWRSRARYDPTRGSVRVDARHRSQPRDRRPSPGGRPRPETRSRRRSSSGEEGGAGTHRGRGAAPRDRPPGEGALGALPTEQSQVIELAYFGGFTHSEIARMLEMPLGTVKGRMRLGLEKIRARFAEGVVE